MEKTATSANICSAREKIGLLPLDVEKVLENKYIGETQESDTNFMNSSKCKIEINGLEITSFAKRLEISRHCSNMQDLLVPLPMRYSNIISSHIRTGKENLLSSDCNFYINLGYGYGFYRM